MLITKKLVKKFEMPKTELKRELDEIMAGSSLDSLLADSCSFKLSVAQDEVISGKVVSMRDDVVLVDFGGKSEAKLPYHETGSSNDDLDIGDVAKFLVSRVSDKGLVSLTRKNIEMLVKQREVVASLSVGDKVEGRLIQHTKNGWLVSINQLPAMLPAHQEYLIYTKEGPEALINTYIEAEIESIYKMDVVLTRRAFAGEIKKKAKESFFTSLVVGDIVEGSVKNVTKFGAFLQVASGIIGLCHTSDFGAEALCVGDKVKSRILKIDRDKNRISLGIRQVTEPSWEELVSTYYVGALATAVVTSIVPYGAFLQIEPGVSGLAHVSDLSWSDHIKHPKEILTVGDRVDVAILGIDAKKQHLSLGLKQVTEDPWETVSNRYLAGYVYDGRVTNKTKFGIFVELEQGVEGLAHHTVVSQDLDIGAVVPVSILRIDASRKRVSLAIE